MYCIRCGRRLVPGKSIGPLCVDCLLEEYRLLCVPTRLVFDYCKYCGAFRLGHRWRESSGLEEASSEFLRLYLSDPARVTPCRDHAAAIAGYELVELVPVTIPSWRTVYRATYRIVLQGVDEPVTQSYQVVAQARPTICPLCKDARGGDYNVLLQLRGARPAEIAKALEDLFENNRQVTGSIVDIIEYENGADILLLDRGSASKILRQLKRRFRVRTKVTGEDVGVTSTGRLRRRQVISATLSVRRRK